MIPLDPSPKLQRFEETGRNGRIPRLPLTGILAGSEILESAGAYWSFLLV